MSKELADRLEFIVKQELSGNWAELARKTDLQPSTLQQLKKGGSPREDTLLRISISLNVSPTWLLLGEGPMHRQTEPQEPEQAPEPDPRMIAIIKTVQMMPLEKQQEFLAETQKRAESIKQLIEMQERIERLEKEKCA